MRKTIQFMILEIASKVKMRKIKFKDFLNILLNSIIEPNINLPTFYLQDGDNNYHKVSEVDLYKDRICCEAVIGIVMSGYHKASMKKIVESL